MALLHLFSYQLTLKAPKIKTLRNMIGPKHMFSMLNGKKSRHFVRHKSAARKMTLLCSGSPMRCALDGTSSATILSAERMLKCILIYCVACAASGRVQIILYSVSISPLDILHREDYLCFNIKTTVESCTPTVQTPDKVTQM